MWNGRIRQLRAGLADRLRGDDADRKAQLVDVDDRVPLSGSTMCQANWRSAEPVVARDAGPVVQRLVRQPGWR